MARTQAQVTEKVRRVWDKQAPRFDKSMAFWERRLFRGDREWACAQAEGDVLEFAVGTGRNFRHYPAGVRLTGFDLSPEMVARARATASELGLDAHLTVADATELGYADASFDTILCTYSLCSIPDAPAAVRQMHRLLRPGGRAILAEHVRSPNPVVRALEALGNLVISPFMCDDFLGEPDRYLREAGFEVGYSQRRKAGFVHRLVATKPA
ncbi:MAG TPA: methyltransferase domain-containing protein [Egibacteraceae bacterium]|nr:methyltransferase domain-containing protein [Egibacteraceae bacterium]